MTGLLLRRHRLLGQEVQGRGILLLIEPGSNILLMLVDTKYQAAGLGCLARRLQKDEAGQAKGVGVRIEGMRAVDGFIRSCSIRHS